ncbi:carbohydrate kinase family protein [Limnochorda pilosa]|uniref:Carbohydrate kinase n=1 Tax=Limnochorda pilosa TaxID=1555112 RepID=A0A0K2SLC6_LIMPI|nr:carbohydrate kinase family protein [Limnochorda pilosa]BAS27905.1 carbohydrate kinase [Limnochorda pilosa]
MAPRPIDCVVLGDLNVDLILAGLQGEPAFGQERTVSDALLTLGASAGIFASDLARLGARVAFVGRVGNDHFGRFTLETLRGEGVDLEQVAVDPTRKTGVTVSVTRPDEKMLITFPGTTAHVSPADVDPALLPRARHLHVASYYLVTSLRDHLPRVLREARASGLTTSLDPGHDPESRWRGIEACLPLLDVFLPNEEEARAITSQADPVDAAVALARTVPRVAVKLGSGGAILALQGGGILRAGPHPIEPVDTTGAGDGFSAGFVWAFLRRLEPADALAIANACGALATRYLGGTAGFPRLPDVLALVPDVGLRLEVAGS